jgi:CP family cyanate transporter-like MFS transporter
LKEDLKALAALWLFGICLRITVLAIPPVIPLIHQSFELSQSAVGALTSLPVLLFSFVAIPGSILVARFGARVGPHTRDLHHRARLRASRRRGRACPGSSSDDVRHGRRIAIMQPALPAVVANWVPRPDRASAPRPTPMRCWWEKRSALRSRSRFVLAPPVSQSWRASMWVWGGDPVFAIGILGRGR